MTYGYNPLNYLIEAARIDSKNSILEEATQSDVMREMGTISEVSYNPVMLAEMVPVVNIDNNYLTEMTFLLPFMKSNGIKSVAEALDIVAEVNNLGRKSVGLLIESDETCKKMIKNAKDKAKKENDPTIFNKVLDKVKGVASLGGKLKDKGYQVLKKKSDKKDNIKECKK